jgi:hypothetical protein
MQTAQDGLQNIHSGGQPGWNVSRLVAMGKTLSEASNKNFKLVASKAQESVDKSICCLCQEQPATFAAIPCGHRCLCEADAARFRAHSQSQKGKLKCPLCMADVSMVVQIF